MNNSVYAVQTSEPTRVLMLTYLPRFAEYILHKKLKKFSREAAALSDELNFPLLKYTTLLPQEYQSVNGLIKLLLQAIADNKAVDYLKNGIALTGHYGASYTETGLFNSENILIINELSRKIFTRFIPEFTSDISEALSIVDELNEMLHLAEHVSSRENTGIVTDQDFPESPVLVQKQYEELQEAKSVLQAVLDASLDIITAVDENENVIAANKKALEFGNFKPEEIMNKKVLDVMPNLRDDPAYGYLKRAIKGEHGHVATYATSVNSRYQESFYIPLQINDKLKGALTIHRDITDIVTANNTIRQANLELEESNNRLKASGDFLHTLINSTPDYFVAIDRDLKYLLINKMAAKRINRQENELIGKSMTEIFPGIENHAIYENIRSCFETKSVIHADVTSILDDARRIQTVFIPLITEFGNVEGILMTGRDVTTIHESRQQLENAKIELERINLELKKSEELYHKMVSEVENYAIVLIDENGFVENWNKGAEHIKGYKSHEIIGKHFSIFYTAEDRSASLPDQLLERALTTGKSEHEGWRVRKDGTLFWGTIVMTALYNENKELIGFVKVTRDLTERKKKDDQIKEYSLLLEIKNKQLRETNYKLEMAREQLADDRTRLLANAIPLIVALTNADGELEFTNQMLAQYTGADFESLKNLGWLSYVHEEDLKSLTFALEKSILQEKIFEGECRLRRMDGKYLWHSVIAKPLQDEKGNTLKWVVAISNIHQQKINDARKDEFMGIASHELKTPLTGIKAYIQLLRESIEANKFGDAKFLVRKADQSISRLSDLITELLDITSIQYGKLNLHISNFDFNEMVDESIGLVHSSKHLIRKNTDRKLMIGGDRDRLQQVVINLLSNAVKYSPDSRFVDIEIRSANEMLEMKVIDYGIGIAKGDLDKIFTRFYRVERNAHQFQGLGIGLFIASEIIQRHGGKMKVESDPGKGSAFSFIIPLQSKVQK